MLTGLALLAPQAVPPPPMGGHGRLPGVLTAGSFRASFGGAGIAERGRCVTKPWSAVLDLVRDNFLSGFPQVAAQCFIPPSPSRGCAGLASLGRP